MTVNNLHTQVIKRQDYDQDNGKNRHLLKHLVGDGESSIVIGVDLSIWLYQVLRAKLAAECYHTKPEMPNELALNGIKERHRALVVNGLIPIYVFDGAYNPIKKGTNDERKQKLEGPLQELVSLLKGGRPQDLPRIEKLRKCTVAVCPSFLAEVQHWMDSEGIAYIQAPVEAEQQLVKLEKDNQIDIILSDDGNTVVLGGQSVMTNVKWTTKDLQKISCCIYDKDEIWDRPSAGRGQWRQWLPELACFLGNDYMMNLLGFGPKRVSRELDHFISLASAELRCSYLQKLEENESWSTIDKAAGRNADGFAHRFQQTAAFIRHAPVFEFTRSHESVEIDFCRRDSYTVHLVPLNPFPAGGQVSDANWGKAIGFGIHPMDVLPTANLKALADLMIWGRSAQGTGATGGKLPRIPQPHLVGPPHYPVAHGSYLDFEACPAELQPDRNLAFFLFIRGLAPKGRLPRERLVDLVKGVIELEERCPGAVARPKQLSQLRLNSASYQVFESLMPRTGSEDGLVWSGDDSNICESIRKVQMLDDNAIGDIFGPGKNGIRYRALKRIKGGNYDISTLQVSPVQIVDRDGEDGKALAFRIKVTPSMKSVDYWTVLVFEDRVGGSYVHAPASRCECPCGAEECSHKLGAKPILHLLQMHTEWTLLKLANVLPKPIKSVVSKPIPWRFVFDVADRQSRRKTRRDVSITKSGRRVVKRRRVTSQSTMVTELFPTPNANGGLNAAAAAAADDDDDDDSEDDDSLVSDQNWSNNESNDGDSKDDDLDSDDDASISDSELEAMAAWERVKCEDVSLNEELARFLASAPGYLSSVDAEDEFNVEHKVSSDNIDRANDDKLAGIGGPNESVEAKLEQLHLHQKLDTLFEKGELEKCVLSHYLLATRHARGRWLKQLESVKTLELAVIMPPTRLRKIPPGTSVLADRGFSACAQYYPNLNPQITPFFLDGRDHFTSEEITADRDKCRLRYASEAVFSRVWLLASVRDKVGRGFFETLHHFVDWAHGMANFMKPYYLPGRDDYFSKDWDGELQTEACQSYIDYAIPKEYVEAGMAEAGVLKDGKDFVTDTIRVNPAVTRALFSDKVKSSGARIITWALPTGLIIEHTGLYLGRAPEMRLVELWGK